MKLKKLWALILAVSLLAGTSVLAFADEREPYYVSNTTIPSSIKIGEMLGEEWYDEGVGGLVTGYEITFHNLEPNTEVRCFNEDSEFLFSDQSALTFNEHGGAGCDSGLTDETGSMTVFWSTYYAVAFAPTTFTFQPGYEYFEDIRDDDNTWLGFVFLSEWKNIGDPITIKVEEPVIETNAPATIKKGESLNLTTELTNTALTNTDTAYYLDENNYIEDPNVELFYEDPSAAIVYRELIDDDTHKKHMPAYQPSVEIIEGQDLVKQSNQDYSNTLKSSETLTFTGTGTVKLKVKYNQFITCSNCQHATEYEDLEFGYSGTVESIDKGYDITYSPEKIITIQVTEDEVTDPSSDSDPDTTDPGNEQGTDTAKPEVMTKNTDKKTAGTNVAKTEQKKASADKPNTADNNDVTLLIWTLIISAEALAVLIICRRKIAS